MLEAAASGLGEVRSASRTMALKWPPEPRILPSVLGGHRVVWPATSRRLNRLRAGPASQGRPAQPVTGGRWGRGTAGSRVPRRPFEAGAGRVQRPCGRFERRPPARTGPFEGPVPRPSRLALAAAVPVPARPLSQPRPRPRELRTFTAVIRFGRIKVAWSGLCESYNGGGAAPAIARVGADSMVTGVGAREAPLRSGQNRPSASS